MTTENRSQLVEAVAKVMDEVGYVQGTGKNREFGYKYTSDEDLLRKLQPALAKNGLMIAPCEIEIIDSNEKGKWLKQTIRVHYELRHVGGESMMIAVMAEGRDTGDKAVYKALTGAYKYMLRQTFAIPTGDDAEKDDAQPSNGAQRQPPVRQAPTSTRRVKPTARESAPTPPEPSKPAAVQSKLAEPDENGNASTSEWAMQIVHMYSDGEDEADVKFELNALRDHIKGIETQPYRDNAWPWYALATAATQKSDLLTLTQAKWLREQIVKLPEDLTLRKSMLTMLDGKVAELEALVTYEDDTEDAA